jgi:hypothetical protein
MEFGESSQRNGAPCQQRIVKSSPDGSVLHSSSGAEEGTICHETGLVRVSDLYVA